MYTCIWICNEFNFFASSFSSSSSAKHVECILCMHYININHENQRFNWLSWEYNSRQAHGDASFYYPFLSRFSWSVILCHRHYVTCHFQWVLLNFLVIMQKRLHEIMSERVIKYDKDLEHLDVCVVVYIFGNSTDRPGITRTIFTTSYSYISRTIDSLMNKKILRGVCVWIVYIFCLVFIYSLLLSSLRFHALSSGKISNTCLDCGKIKCVVALIFVVPLCLHRYQR